MQITMSNKESWILFIAILTLMAAMAVEYFIDFKEEDYERAIIRYELAHNEYVIFKDRGWTNLTFEEWYAEALPQREKSFKGEIERFRNRLEESWGLNLTRRED